jgi:lysophospholipid acyltransferase (LPLAT)-like uncharacterized protein
MFKRIANSAAIPYLGGTLIWAYQSMVSHTVRWRVEGVEHLRKLWAGDDGWILATWHSRILLMSVPKIIYGPKWGNKLRPPALMVSNSRDGEFTNRTAHLLGLAVIRGSAANKAKSKDKRGVLAAREAISYMRNGGGVVITIDGPKGPPEVVGLGAIKLAQQVGAQILVYGLAAEGKRLNTWDRLLLPRPFGRGAMVIHEPIPASKAMDSEELRARVEKHFPLAVHARCRQDVHSRPANTRREFHETAIRILRIVPKQRVHDAYETSHCLPLVRLRERPLICWTHFTILLEETLTLRCPGAIFIRNMLFY